MIASKARSLRLGRRLVRIWRWAQPRPGLLRRHQRRTPGVSEKLLRWGRCFLRRLRCGGDGGYHRLGHEPAAAEETRPPPKGYLAVYVAGEDVDSGGGASKRYVVPVLYFNHPLFGELLRESEAEFGFDHPGGITIPCPVSRFERVRTCIASAAGCS